MTKFQTLFASTSAAALLSAALLTPNGARAESMDYGALQDLFGEPVTVSATGTPQKASDVAANMTIITADQIRRAGTRNIAQIVGMNVPGIDVLEGSNGNFDLGVRGYQQGFQPRLLVLIDGRQVFIDDYSRTNWNNLPVNVDDIRQIEVVKGPASALFGSNAAAGAINIVTYSANYDHNRVATISGGTQGTIGADASGSYNGAWGGFKISAGTRDENAFTTGVGAADTSTVDPKHRYFAASTVINAAPDLHLNLEYTYSESKQTTALPLGNMTAEYDRAYSLRGGFDWKTKLGTIISDTYYNHNFSSFNIPAGGYLNTDLLVTKLEDRFALGAHHTFRVMVEYRNKKMAVDNRVAPNPPTNSRLEENAIAAGGSWLWQISEALSWTNAVRFDHLSMQQNGLVQPLSVTNASTIHGIDAWSANSGLAYKAGLKDTIRLTYGRGIIMPSMLQSGGTSQLVNRGPDGFGGFIFVDVLGNSHLQPTIVQNVELGHEHRFNSLDSTLKTSVFYSLNHNLLGNNQAAASLVSLPNVYIPFGNQNVGGSRSLGAEIELSGQNARGFRWDASYSYVHVKDQITPFNSPGTGALAYSNSTPEHHVRLSAGYTAGPWELDANIQYLSQRSLLRATAAAPSGTPTHTGGYVTLGGRIAYTIAERYILAVSATELNHDDLLATAYPRIERQVLASLSTHF